MLQRVSEGKGIAQIGVEVVAKVTIIGEVTDFNTTWNSDGVMSDNFVCFLRDLNFNSAFN